MNRSDDFNRADSAASLGSPSDGGTAWVVLGGGGGISANRAYSTSAANPFLAYLEASTTTAEVAVKFPVLGSNYGVGGRIIDLISHILFAFTAGNFSCYKRVGGTYTQLGSNVAGTVVAGDSFSLSIDSGNAIRGYQNGVLRLGPITDAANSTGTKWGLRFAVDTTARADDFTITDSAGGGAQSIAAVGLASAEAVGAAVVSSLATIAGAGVASGESVGGAAVAPGAVAILAGGLASDETIGSAVVTPGTVTLIAAGLASAEAIGAAMVGTGGLLIGGVGVASAAAVGAAVVSPGPVTLAPAGLASAGALGDPTLSTVATVQAQGIASGEAAGAAQVAPGPAAIAGAGLSSEETVGAAVLTLASSQTLHAIAVGPGEAFGAATITITAAAATVTLRQGLYAHLRSDPALTPLVGRRIYTDLPPPKAGVPSLVFSVLADQRQGNLDGRTGLREARVQIECRSEKRGECVQLAELVDDRLDGVTYSLGGVAVRWCHQEDEQDVTEPIPDGDASNRYLYPVTFTINYRA
jgi:hypothetical protein